ncbi:MAG: hypothetical protein AAFQ98_26230 [Bacteroidota bacterium]
MKIFTLGLLLVLSVPVCAQVGWQYGVGVGGQRHALQDAGHSDLLYTGSNLSFQTEIRRLGEASYQELSGSFSSATLTPKLEMPAAFVIGTADRTWVGVQYRYVRQQSAGADLSWGWGGQVGGYLDLAQYNHPGNNPFGYELSFTLNPYVEATYSLNDRWKLAGHATVPIVGYSMRPTYLGLFPLENLELDISTALASGGLGLPNQLFYLDTRFEVVRMGKKPNREMRLFYQYMGGMNRIVEAKGHASHSVGLSFHFTNWK